MKLAPWKWPGSKARLLPQLDGLFPKEITRLVVPMCGACSEVFWLMRKHPNMTVVVSDLVPELVNALQALRDDPAALNFYLCEYKSWMNWSGDYPKVLYYAERERRNDSSATNHWTQAEKAARFIFLVQSAYNGLWRVNRSGGMNVPFSGKFTCPRAEDLLEFSRLMASRPMAIRCEPYYRTLNHALPGDFVLIDPPYLAQKGTKTHTEYTSGGFGIKEHHRLADWMLRIDQRGCKIMLHNADTPEARELYEGWNITEVDVQRSIGCKVTSRGKTREIVVRNYT